MSTIEEGIRSKIERAGTPLKDWDIKIYRGVLTGYNEAFIIDSEKRMQLIKASPNSDEIIRPILRGKDIQKYWAGNSNLWLLFIPWHYPLQENNEIIGASNQAEQEFKKRLPTIFEHLESYKMELSKRNKAETGIRYEWYALQRFGSNYWQEFEKPKIVWKRIGSALRFSYDETGAFCLDSSCFATGGNVKYLTGVLNSSLCIKELLDNSPKTGTGDVITSVQALEPIRIPIPTDSERNKIEELVDKCITMLSMDVDADLSLIEKEIDELVFKLFGLTEEEKRFILSSLNKL